MYKIGITVGLTVSVRWQHRLAHTDNIQTLVKSPDCLLGKVTQPSGSRLNKTTADVATSVALPQNRVENLFDSQAEFEITN